jgi:uncharacterized protein (DUF1697 family)
MGAAIVSGAGTSVDDATTYVALLRGVNVGGKNRVIMADFRAALSDAGFGEVRTYINSGNALFSVSPTHLAELAKKYDSRIVHSTDPDEIVQAAVHGVIEEAFGLDVTVAALSAAELIDAVDRAPQWWGAGKDAHPEDKHDAIVVIAPGTAAHVADSVGEPRPEYEKEEDRGRIVFWTAAIKTFSRTRWSKVIASSEYYSRITIRNHRTMLKLADLCR